MVKSLYFIVILHFISLIFSIFNLSNPSWIIVLETDFGLVTCTNCKQFKTNWTLECFSQYTCEQDFPYCKLYTLLYTSSAIFILFETLYILFSILLLNRLFLLIFNRLLASSTVHLTLLLFSLIFKISATLQYLFTISKKVDETIKYGSGANLAIFLIVFMVFTSIFTVYSTYNFKQVNQIYKEKPRLFKLDNKAWMLFTTITLITGAYCSVISLNEIYWTKTGTLMRCENCGEIPWMPWQCLAGSECEINSDSSICKEYSQFSEAGKIYLIFSTISTILIILVLDICFSYQAYNEYGFFNLSIVFLLVSAVLQAIGTISWIVKTDETLGFLCKYKNCEGSGGFFACLSFVFITLGTVSFFISAPKICKVKDDDLFQEEFYNDPLAICNTPASSCSEEEFYNHPLAIYNNPASSSSEEDFNSEPLSISFQFLRKKLSLANESELARSTMY